MKKDKVIETGMKITDMIDRQEHIDKPLKIILNLLIFPAVLIALIIQYFMRVGKEFDEETGEWIWRTGSRKMR